MKKHNKMGKINKRTAIKEVEDWISSLNIRPHKLDKLKDHKEDVINMLCYGIIEFDGKDVVYYLEEPFADGTSKIKIVAKRYTVEQVNAMSKEFTGEQIEKQLGIIGMMCEPVQAVDDMMTLQEGFMDLNNICAFFLPV